MRISEIAIRCSAYAKNNILGMVVFAILTGVAGNFVFEFLKQDEKKDSKIVIEVKPLSSNPPDFTPIKRLDQGVHEPHERPTTSSSAPGTGK